jgi:hypothetical protein
MLISNGWTDDLFPPDEAIRFYNRTRTNSPRHADRAHLHRPRAPARAEQGAGRDFRAAPAHAWFDFYVRGQGRSRSSACRR